MVILRAIVILLLLVGSSSAVFGDCPETERGSLTMVLYQYGKELYFRGDYRQAAAVFKRVLMYDANDDGALDYLSRIHQRRPEINTQVRPGLALHPSKKDFSVSSLTSCSHCPGPQLSAVSEIKPLKHRTFPAEGIKTPGRDEHARQAAIVPVRGTMAEAPVTHLKPTKSQAVVVDRSSRPETSATVATLQQQLADADEEIRRLEKTIKMKNELLIDFKMQAASYKAIAEMKKVPSARQMTQLTEQMAQKDRDILALQAKVDDAEERLRRMDTVAAISTERFSVKPSRSSMPSADSQSREGTAAPGTGLLQEKLRDLQNRLDLARRQIAEQNAQIKLLKEQLEQIAPDDQPM